jgi:mercuric ion binding protein
MKWMKTLAIAVCVLLSPVLAHAEEVVISVKGLVCSFCAQSIKKTFSREKGVEKVDVDLDKKIVYVTAAPGEGLTDDRIKTLMTDSGYEVVEIKRQ